MNIAACNGFLLHHWFELNIIFSIPCLSCKGSWENTLKYLSFKCHYLLITAIFGT